MVVVHIGVLYSVGVVHIGVLYWVGVVHMGEPQVGTPPDWETQRQHLIDVVRMSY